MYRCVVYYNGWNDGNMDSGVSVCVLVSTWGWFCSIALRLVFIGLWFFFVRGLMRYVWCWFSVILVSLWFCSVFGRGYCVYC